jgi:tetratricopeptide (TPR) repeat protein
LRHARGEWIFWLDADDRLDEDNRAKLRHLFAGLNGENVAYSMKCLCLPDQATGTSTVVDHVRLFRSHPALRWDYRVHEQILPAIRKLGGEVRWADVTIQHAGYQDPALRGRKLQRDLRLLELDRLERPHDPFTLFNLGSVYQELGRHAEALPLLQRSLELSHPHDSIVRKLYALLVQSHRSLGQPDEALAICHRGLEVCPGDTELLFVEGVLRRERGDLVGAEACLLQVLEAPPAAHFASVDAGLRGYKARHNLAVVYHQQGRPQEAEQQWRAAVAERPDFLPSWLGLAESCLRQQRWQDLAEVLHRLEGLPLHGPREAAVLRARGHLARREFVPAQALLANVIAQHPQALEPRVVLSHVLLQADNDLDAAERALRDVLALAPEHAEARHNLALLQRRRQQAVETRVFGPDVTLALAYQAACTSPSDLYEHLPTLYTLAQQCRHVTEFGTGAGASTTAFLYARPRTLISYDYAPQPEVEKLRVLAQDTEFVFYERDVLQVEIEPTDLLFVDTRHDDDQLRAELALHAGQVLKYLVLHGTMAHAEQGETEGHGGIGPVIAELLIQGSFRLKERFTNNHGLTVLERVQPIPAS